MVFVYSKTFKSLIFFHPSNKILTWAIFIIQHNSFSVLQKIPYVKIKFFRDRSFKWVLNYYFAKCLEILTTGSLQINKFVSKQSVSFFLATVHALHLTGFLGVGSSVPQYGRFLEGSSGTFCDLRWLNTVFDTCVSFTFFSNTPDPVIT